MPPPLNVPVYAPEPEFSIWGHRLVTIAAVYQILQVYKFKKDKQHLIYKKGGERLNRVQGVYLLGLLEEYHLSDA